MYETYKNIISVPASVLYDDLQLLTYNNYKNYCKRGKIQKVRNGGNGRQALIDFKSLPILIKDAVINAYGNPYKKDQLDKLIEKLEPCPMAYDFFIGKGLLPERVKQYYVESQILTAYSQIINSLKLKQANGMAIKMGPAKQEICAIILELKNIKQSNTNENQFPHRLPSNYRALDNKLKKFLTEGADSLIHKAVGNTNSKKIKGKAAEWILDFYSLPNKPVVPVLFMEYMKIRAVYGFPVITESAISKWLTEPKQEKRWYLPRHGKAEWRNKFGHKMTRDKASLFPNAYWAIDGTKLDWVHLKDNSNGMGADIKIDVVFDVYSEKIIGYSFSQSETHIDHFNALKMSVNDTLKRPFLLTYDGQSGHTSKPMQELYSKVVDPFKGKHYKHAARQHGSPVEQLFARFQKQVLNRKWFSDKQGMRTKTMDSRPNMDFLMEHRHELSKIEALEKVFKACVLEWNTSKHPKHEETRQSVHQNHEEILASPISYLQYIDLFWVFTPQARNYDTDGIKPIIGKKQYHFEVYDENDEVDIDFRDYTHKKFFIQYDPSHLDNYVRLYLKLPNGEKRYIKDAQPKRLTQILPALMTPAATAQMRKDRQVRSTELERIEKENAKRQMRTGLTADSLVENQELEFKIGGKLPKQQRSAIEANEWLQGM
jgi:hypothetical protein